MNKHKATGTQRQRRRAKAVQTLPNGRGSRYRRFLLAQAADRAAIAASMVNAGNQYPGKPATG